MVEDGWYVICMQDEGRGMEADAVEKIALYRQFDRTLYEQQGMGMGLAIVKDIMDLCKGKLVIKTRPNEGFQAHLHFEIA
mgnify:CR=1 FL=1